MAQSPRDTSCTQFSPTVHYPTRLQPGYIRLLIVERLETPGEDGIPVRCSLEIFELEEDLSYVALSYSWDTTKKTLFSPGRIHDSEEIPKPKSIPIDGEPLAVTANLFDAFDEICKGDAEGAYWVDAVCINQEDVEERNQQVSMMTEIFWMADLVLVWLGKDSENEAPVVQDLCNRMRDEWVRMQEAEEVRKIHFFESSILQSMGLPDENDLVWRTFTEFWSLRWFHRAWIVQEVAVSKEVHYYWGETWLDRSSLEQTSQFLVHTEASDTLIGVRNMGRQEAPDQAFIQARRVGETLYKIDLIHKLCRHRNHEEPSAFHFGANALTGPSRPEKLLVRLFAKILEVFRGFDTTDDRDRVFSLLALIKMAAQVHGLDPPPLTVDYNKSCEQDFLETTSYIVRESECLNLLCLVQDPTLKRHKELPSWVPDYSSDDQTPILFQWKDRDIVGSAFQSQTLFATNDFKIHDRVLRVRAVELGQVVSVGDSFHEMVNCGLVERTAQLLLSCAPVLPNGQSRVEALWRVMIADSKLSAEHPAPDDFASDFRE